MTRHKPRSISAVGRIDAVAGSGIESIIRHHHRRRLARAGRLDQLEPPDDGLWCAGDPEPRSGCAVEVLVDGAAALPAIADALGAARSSVHLAGWHVAPDFGLERDQGAQRLRDLLGELAERLDVRVLLWAGAPLPVFTPSRGEVRRARDELTRGTRIACALDGRERPMHCHHEKIVVIDGEVAFVGGIDLTSLAGDRYDSSAHAYRHGRGWHDVAARLTGPIVGDVAAHFAHRWEATSGERLPIPASPPPEGRGVEVQLARTVPERVYPFAPRGEFRVLESYVRALRSARRLVYLESQFLWSPEVVDILAAKLREPPEDGFRVVVLLPARPDNGADTSRGQLGVLADADGGRGRFLATTVSSRTGALSGALYVHAKVGIVDDSWMTIGSANLNEHSLFNDTEVNLVCTDGELVRRTRTRLWSEHLERPVESLAGEPTRVIDELWRPIAVEQLERRRRGEAPTHRLQELPGVSRRSMALLGPLQGILVDG